MAGDWIKMMCDLHDSPKVEDIADALGLDTFAVIGRLHALWSWVGKISEDGADVNTTDERINRRVECDTFATLLRQVGWITGENRSITFVNFTEHNGATAKKRSVDSARIAKKRTCRKSVANKATETRPEKRREEKRREEEKIKSAKKVVPFSPDFEAWWKIYPARPGCPKGNKREAFAAWLKLDREQILAVHTATKNLQASIATTNTLPKDAERFLRPPRGQGDPAYLAWVNVAAPPPKLRINDQDTCGEENILEKLKEQTV